MLPNANKDQQSITADWTFTDRNRIDGVLIREVKHVPKDNGHLTEIFRRDWALDDGVVDQVFQVVLLPGEVSAWHTHQFTRDRLFVTHGAMAIALYDARPESPTCGTLKVLRLGFARPALVIIPPLVWHGVQNIGAQPAAILNLVDRAYQYEDPDHWRLPADTDQIPYRFKRSSAAATG